MKLKSLNKLLSFLILFTFCPLLNAEEEIDIWNKAKKEKSKIIIQNEKNLNTINNSPISNTNNINNDIKIDDKISDSTKNIKIFGIYDPSENGFDLNMWSQTEAEDVKSSFNRINKIKLSNTAAKLFEKTILSIAYPPKGMEEKEFINFKINWMIKNKKINLIEKF